MTALAAWLLLLGVLDLVRGARDASRPRLLLGLAGTAVLLSVGCALLLGPAPGGWPAWVLAALGGAGWLAGSGVAMARFRRVIAAGPVPTGLTAGAAAAVAYAGLGVGGAALLLAGDAAGTARLPAAGWARTGLAAVPFELALLVTALLVVQIATANVAVRLLLDLVGVPASDNEKTLRGGRVLGPMERLVIVGLAVGGSLTGAALVVAAKALLRFPELRVPRADDPGYGGASDVTEYFLVGSFASWLVALASVALVALAGG